MKTRFTSMIGIAVLLLSLVLTGCGGGGEEPTSTPQGEEPVAKSLSVTISNSSDYIFNEIYISPTASDDWGSDHLGSTSLLKSGGSYDITLDKYDFDNFDIKVIDEDKDEYIFTYVPLVNGTTVDISFSDGLCAVVTGPDGEESVVYGELVSDSGGSDEYDELDSYSIEFTIYNESEYDIYAVYMMPAYDDGEAVDILPDILAAGESYDVYLEIDAAYAGVNEWNISIVDVDGDESAFYEVFDPWTLSYVDIYWSNDDGGYICEYSY